MKASIIWWDLKNSKQTIDSLAKYLVDEGVRPWAKVKGLRLMFWIADRVANRWGAVLLWESPPGDQPLPPHKAAEIIGYQPDRLPFDVEATVEGIYSESNLSFKGRVFEEAPAARPPSTWEEAKPQRAAPEESKGPSEFDKPPADPVRLFRTWFDNAVDKGARDPGVLSLATVSAGGRPSNRMVKATRITEQGLVFASFANSPKGREIAETGWASGVFYWHELIEQVVITGKVERLPDSESDALWAARPPFMNPMSVATRQSEPLLDEAALRAEVQRLANSGKSLPRPADWVAYHLVASTVEFWRGSPDRMYQRLRYDRAGSGWKSIRLQP